MGDSFDMFSVHETRNWDPKALVFIEVKKKDRLDLGLDRWVHFADNGIPKWSGTVTYKGGLKYHLQSKAYIQLAHNAGITVRDGPTIEYYKVLASQLGYQSPYKLRSLSRVHMLWSLEEAAEKGTEIEGWVIELVKLLGELEDIGKEVRAILVVW